jgi:Rhodopirellula transposase DDE domain
MIGEGGKQEKLRLYWKVREERKQILRQKFERLRPHLGERATRLWAANEALSFGTGGVRAVAEALAISPKTVIQGKRELLAPADVRDSERGEERQRRPGGGRKSILEKHPQLRSLIEQIVDPATRGDPMKPLRWVSKSLPHIAEELDRQGYQLSLPTVSDILHQELGYGMQGLRKTREGSSHKDRDAQFQYINQQCQALQPRAQPVISIDSKKKELVGDFKNGGREWNPKGQPEPVRVHDFEDKQKGACPVKAGMFSGDQSHRGKSQEPRSLDSRRRETELLKPIDKAIFRMVSKSPGRNASEPIGGLESLKIRRPNPRLLGEGSIDRRN